MQLEGYSSSVFPIVMNGRIVEQTMENMSLILSLKAHIFMGKTVNIHLLWVFFDYSFL